MRYPVGSRPRAPLALRAVLLLCLTLLGSPPPAALADEPSAGVLLRRARYALAEGRRDEAREALRAARRAEPRTRRGLEAALLLADLELARGDASAADGVLGDAQHDFPDGEASAQLLLARGWLAVGRLDAAAAQRHFGLVPARTGEHYAVDLAALGTAWSRLVASDGQTLPGELTSLSAAGHDPILRVGALLSLARAHAARGEHKRALRTLRKLRRLVRGASFADDVELAIGLTQLDMGNASAARRTFRRTADLPASAAPAVASVGDLTLRDLRLPPRDFAARLAQLYATRTEPSTGIVEFFVATFDRDARRDVAAALSLADAAVAARRES